MSDDFGDAPDPYRAALLQSVFRISPLHEVAEAVAVATEHERRLYVERMARGWRWSLTHPGGVYPLLRITARYLKINYSRLMITCRAIDGFSILCSDPARPLQPRAHGFITFDGPTTADEVALKIRSRGSLVFDLPSRGRGASPCASPGEAR